MRHSAGLGAPEGAYFDHSPGWSIGVYGIGFEPGVTDYHVMHAALAETLPIGTLAAGVYYGLGDEALFASPDGDEARFGVLASWISPGLDLPLIDKLYLVWDVQTGANAFGGTGGGIAVYFTPAIALLTGPVFFFEPSLQPGGSSFLWSVQVDIDIDLGSDAP